MKLFRSRKKFEISDPEVTYKVRYLGNVQTALMKGDGCVDKPTTVLWNNYLKTANAGLDMSLTICASGLKALTHEQGLTEYRAHRISYCIAHPKFPKLFVWVYRHEGKRMKVELRCHAVLCRKEAVAKAMAVQLHDKLSVALSEFMREKSRRQTSRLALSRHNSLPSSISNSSGLPTRNRFLTLGQNFKPSVERSPGAPKLGSITEDKEPEDVQVRRFGSLLVEALVEEEEEEEEEAEEPASPVSQGSASSMPSSYRRRNITDTALSYHNGTSNSDPDLQGAAAALNGGASIPVTDLCNGVFDLEIGNDIEELKRDQQVQFAMGVCDPDSDGDESWESGFLDQQEASSAGSSTSTSSGPSLNSVESRSSPKKCPEESENVMTEAL